jgi:hypothetical protein
MHSFWPGYGSPVKVAEDSSVVADAAPVLTTAAVGEGMGASPLSSPHASKSRHVLVYGLVPAPGVDVRNSKPTHQGEWSLLSSKHALLQSICVACLEGVCFRNQRSKSVSVFLRQRFAVGSGAGEGFDALLAAVTAG